MGCAASTQAGVPTIRTTSTRGGSRVPLFPPDSTPLGRARASMASIEPTSPCSPPAVPNFGMKEGRGSSWTPMIGSPVVRSRSSSSGGALPPPRPRPRPRREQGPAPALLVDGQPRPESVVCLPVPEEPAGDEGYVTPLASPRISRMVFPAKSPSAEDEGHDGDGGGDDGDEPIYDSAAALGVSATALRMAAAFEAALDAEEASEFSGHAANPYTLGAADDPYSLPDDSVTLPPTPDDARAPPPLPTRQYRKSGARPWERGGTDGGAGGAPPPPPDDDVAAWFATAKQEIAETGGDCPGLFAETGGDGSPGRAVSELGDVSIVSNVSAVSIMSTASGLRRLVSMPPPDDGDRTVYTKVVKTGGGHGDRDRGRSSSA